MHIVNSEDAGFATNVTPGQKQADMNICCISRIFSVSDLVRRENSETKILLSLKVLVLTNEKKGG